ncbi:MAG: DUF4493 domain-containing protein [Bacteroidales bacterium]|nr:DUF4493 domain-containing protein [Bacteroidales bacterium]
MKTFLRVFATLLPLLLLPVSCQDLFRQEKNGSLLISLRGLPATGTRAGTELPDTGDYLLTVSGSSGNILYSGPFSQSPDILTVPAGSYTVSAVSCPFEAPAFDMPQWGDTQVVSVASGSSIAVTLDCSQLNSGLRLELDPSFRQAFPEGSLSLKSADGELPCGYDETRTAYFRPGPVSLLLEDSGFTQSLFTRTLEARQILTMRISANVETKSGSISLQVDTSRTWLSDRIVIGGQGAAAIDEAYEVSAARNHADEKGVWVCGYIVGTATGSGKIAFSAPFTKNTNLVLGTRASTRDKEYCLCVELPKGDIRDALNLVDNPALLGRKIYIKGDLVSAYYGIPGLKAPSEYQIR